MRQKNVANKFTDKRDKAIEKKRKKQQNINA